jgi:hypothetical protein
LKTTFSQHKTRFNPEGYSAVSMDTRPDCLLPRQNNLFRRSSPQESSEQKKDVGRRLQNIGVNDGAEMHKKFKSASLNPPQGTLP